MFISKQNMSAATRAHFKITRDPFNNDVESPEDIFLTPDIRYVRETMYSTAKHGGLLAVVGESGAGKSTLRRDLYERIQRDHANVTVIEPYVLGMEENDKRGKTLKSAQLAEAIIRALDPKATLRVTPEARFRQMHDLLKESRRVGNSHVMIIEEAHCLPTATLKHIKRFLELEDGLKRLLGIILIGQPELRVKLSEKNAEVREVVQRCEIVELPPLTNHVAEYLTFKFKRTGLPYDAICAPDVADALAAKLTFQRVARGQSNGATQTLHSLLYPLAIANAMTAAMNAAQELGAPLVDAGIVNHI